MSYSLQPALRPAGATPEVRSPAPPNPIPPTFDTGDHNVSSTPSPSLSGSPPPNIPLPPSIVPDTEPRPARRSSFPAPPFPKIDRSSSSYGGAASPARRRTVLLTWGQNACGQLGFGDFATRILPQAMEYFRSATLARVVCGSRTTIALDVDGKVFAWGKGDDGTLGIGERSTALKPRLIEGLLRQPIAQMTCRGAHVLALTERGQLWAWGRNDDGQLGTRATAGNERGIAHTHSATPERVRGLMGITVTHVACGRCRSMAVDSSGRLHSWGGNDDGALGHGDTTSRASPVVVSAFTGRKVVGVACGSRHTLALVDETLYSWGWGVYGQLGHGDVGGRLEPTPIEALDGARLAMVATRPQIACGYRHSMVVCSPDPRGGGGGGGGAAGGSTTVEPRDVYVGLGSTRPAWYRRIRE